MLFFLLMSIFTLMYFYSNELNMYKKQKQEVFVLFQLLFQINNKYKNKNMGYNSGVTNSITY